MYTVTRQVQWPEGDRMVEVSSGGRDYTNPDALVARYSGEFEEFSDPREAIEVAIEIARMWRKDSGKRVAIGYGATGGMTMPFEPITVKAARKWAAAAYKAAPKCEHCGGLLPPKGERYHLLDSVDEAEYCREYCAEEAYAAEQAFSESITQDETSV